MSFEDLPAPLRDALAARGYAAATPVQAAVLAPEAAGRDLLVSAQTGSGKTVAYGLALAPELIGTAPRLPQAGAPLALVVAPTRELALQVKAELAWLYAPAGGRVVSCVGGMDPVVERRLLAQGAHIVVGTPGRLRDHLERGNLAPGSLRAIVLDEADEMLDLGFKEELEAILEETPEGRRTLMFSATVPRAIAALAKGYQRDALRLEVGGEREPHGDIEYRALMVAPHEIERAVVNVLRLEDPRIAMVFCATRAAVARLHGNLAPGSLRAIVLDEADEMLDLGFKEELEAILEETPEGRRTLMFSATVPRAIAALAKGYQRDALRLEVGGEREPHGDIEYRALMVAPHEIERAVVNVLRLEDPRIAMVFCATRAAVARLHGNLAERGFSTVALSGELSQAERLRALQALRDGRARVCVATDVAARGIDLPDLGLVIHAELPRDPETLLHRSGRTGRAGRKGVSVLLVPHTRRRIAERLVAGARVKASLGPAPSAEAIRARDAERLAAQVLALAAEEAAEEDLAVACRLLAEPALAGRGAEALAAALVRVLRAPLPAPEELAEIADHPAPRPARDAPVPQGGAQEGIWFRVDVGRDGRADPKWLLPFLCRRGHVTRQEIGRIRILGRETQFEVAPYAAARFAAAARRADGDDAHIRVEPMQPMQPVQGPPRRPRPPAGAATRRRP